MFDRKLTLTKVFFYDKIIKLKFNKIFILLNFNFNLRSETKQYAK